ncbi:MAG: AMP-binding protein [Gammaproteobacteria bacterium]|nr:AMP-binding protein [Gammaproteobacteria bacterium]
MTMHYDQRESRTNDERAASLTTDVLAHIVHANTHSPAYAEILGDVDIGDLATLEDIAALPLTRKSELIERQGQAPPFGGLAALTGEPLTQIFASPGPIFEPQTARVDYWRTARALFAAGIRSGSLVHNGFSYHLTPAGSMLENGCHALGAAVVPGGVGNTEQQLETIGLLKPDAYCGTPSFLGILLDRADEAGLDVSSIDKALVSGEAYLPNLRQKFANRGITGLQCYATADVGLIAYESSAESGMIVDEDVYLEIVRPGTGEPLPDGEVGEVVVTPLNPDYPLIRFATGDLSVILSGTSPCGRTNRRIKGWMGRADQTVKVRGMFVHPSQVNSVVRRHSEIRHARLVVERLDQADAMTLYCECEHRAEGLADAIAGTIRELCKLRGGVELVEPGTLPNDGIVIEDKRSYD